MVQILFLVGKVAAKALKDIYKYPRLVSDFKCAIVKFILLFIIRIFVSAGTSCLMCDYHIRANPYILFATRNMFSGFGFLALLLLITFGLQLEF